MQAPPSSLYRVGSLTLTNSMTARWLVLTGVILTAVDLLPTVVSAQTYGGRSSEAQPRLAWLRTESPALERSGRHAPQASWRPAMWNGLYAGIDAGYAWGNAEPAYRYDSVGIDGGLLGGHIGYNWEYERLVLGLETDAASSGADGRRRQPNGDHLDVRNTWLSSLRFRSGLGFGNVLAYATGGIAIGGFEGELAGPGTRSQTSEARFGYVFGGGLEMKLTESLSGRIEALHYGFNDKSFEFAAEDLRLDLSVTTVRAGLTYHFNY